MTKIYLILKITKKNKKYGYVYKSQLHSKLKYGEHPFAFKNEYGEITNTTFLCRI